MRWLVLGPLEVWRDGRQLTLGGPKQKLVLAHLLLRRDQLVSSEQLIEQIWGEEAPEAARSSLHAYVSNLRKELSDGCIESRSGGYMLRIESHAVDMERFEGLARQGRRALAVDPRQAAELLEEALALWRGEPFADLAYERSLLFEIERLKELRAEGEADRIEAELLLGRQAELVPRLEELLRTHPLNERLWGQLMLALYRSDRQAEALAAFHRLRATLADELGIEPSPSVSRLHTQMLQQDPALEIRGEPLRGYQLMERIGSGAASATYRAYQPHVGREVLIKWILPPLANDADFIRRFEARAQVIARLEHPRIVPLYDYWREPDGAYLVMRHLSGGSLREALQTSGAITAERAAGILEQVGEGLAAAHRHRVTHGDLTTDNVLLDEEGNAYLANFALDEAGVDAGTGPMRDIRALASLTYELIAGSRIGVTGSPLNMPSVPPAKLPPGLAAVLERALSADHHAGGPVDVAAFVAELRLALAGDSSGPSVTRPAHNPYKGLHSFGEADAADFFGREALVSQLLERLRSGPPAGRLLAVVGPSGSGKSSVVQAGLLPELRRGAVEGSEHWYIVQMVPGDDPFAELQRALRGVATTRLASLVTRPRDGRRTLLSEASQLLPEENAQLLLIIDQFEELFTQVADEGLRRDFIRALYDAVTLREARLRAIVTLRADFYDRPLAYRQLARLLAQQTVVVAPLAPEELEHAVRGPAQRAGVSVENELTARLIADVTDQPGALPLLQYTLTELFDRRQGTTMTLDAYHAVGGVEGALAQRATEIYSTLDKQGRIAARHLFLRLVTPSEAGTHTRRRVRRSDLATLEADQAALEQLIARLGAHRLLSFDRDPETREPTVEVAHEALFSAWPRLSRWIESARVELRAHRRLAEAVAEWEAGGRDASFLLGGRRLAEVEGLPRSRTIALTSRERTYLSASLELREAERRERAERDARERMLERRSVARLRALTVVLALAFVVSSALGFIALDQRDIGEREALRAERESLAADAARLGSLALRVDTLDLSLLLSLAASQLYESPESSAALLTSLMRAPAAVRVLHGDGDQLLRLALSPDGAILATADNNGTVVLFDLETGKWVGEPLEFGTVVALAFSPGGGQLAVYVLERGAVIPSLAFVDLQTRGISTQAAGDWAATFASGIRRGVVMEEEIIELLFPSLMDQTAELVALPFALVRLPGHEAVFVSALESDESAVIDLPSGKASARFPLGGWSDVTRDGRLAVLASGRGVALLDLATGETRQFDGSHAGMIQSVSFTPDGRALLTAGDDGQLMVWDVASGALREAMIGHGGTITDIVVSEDGRTALTSSVDGAVIMWDLGGSRRFERTLERGPHDGAHFRLARDFSPDGSLLALSDGSGGVALWDAGSLIQLGDAFGHEHGPITTARFTPDGKQLATIGPSGSYLWDLATRRVVMGPIDEDVEGAGHAVFSPDGFHLAVAHAAGGVFIWDVASGGIGLHIPTGEDALELDYSPDGTQLAVALDGGEVGVWDLTQLTLDDDGIARPTRIWSLAADPHAATTAQFAPDGRLLATGGTANTVTIWDLLTGQPARSMTHGRAGFIAHLEFHPDGLLLATGGSDGSLALWDIESGQRYGSLSGPANEVALPLFAPDGSSVAAVYESGAVYLWPVDSGQWRARACGVAGRPLTEAEWRQYVSGTRPFQPVCFDSD